MGRSLCPLPILLYSCHFEDFEASLGSMVERTSPIWQSQGVEAHWKLLVVEHQKQAVAKQVPVVEHLLSCSFFPAVFAPRVNPSCFCLQDLQLVAWQNWLLGLASSSVASQTACPWVPADDPAPSQPQMQIYPF